MDSFDEPTIIWRLQRGPSLAHATILPGPNETTITWFFDGTMDRAENYQTMDLALARAAHIRSILERDGWTEAEPTSRQ